MSSQGQTTAASGVSGGATSAPAPASASSSRTPFVGLGGIRPGGLPTSQGVNAGVFGGTGSIVADAASGSASRSKGPDQFPPLFASNQDLPVSKEIMEAVEAFGVHISKQKTTLQQVTKVFAPSAGEDGSGNESYHVGDVEIVRAEIAEVKIELHDLGQLCQKNERALEVMKVETDVYKEMLESISLSMDSNFNVMNKELCIDTCDKAMRVLMADSKQRLINVEKGIKQAEQLLRNFDEPVISMSDLVKTLDATRQSVQLYCTEAQLILESCEKMRAFFARRKPDDMHYQNKIASIYSLISFGSQINLNKAN